jgi:hypothetical protein
MILYLETAEEKVNVVWRKEEKKGKINKMESQEFKTSKKWGEKEKREIKTDKERISSGNNRSLSHFAHIFSYIYVSQLLLFLLYFVKISRVKCSYCTRQSYRT